MSTTDNTADLLIENALLVATVDNARRESSTVATTKAFSIKRSAMFSELLTIPPVPMNQEFQ